MVGCCATCQSKANRPMLVSVANWLRWRRLANASPKPLLCTQGLRLCVWPKYCNKPKNALAKAANSQLTATVGTVSRDLKSQTATAHAAETSHGWTAGEGPLAKGLSHGTMSTAPPVNDMNKKCLQPPSVLRKQLTFR
jgi:hypothetical protein